MKNKKENLATDVISYVVKQRNIWIAAAVVSIFVNIIQWILGSRGNLKYCCADRRD